MTWTLFKHPAKALLEGIAKKNRGKLRNTDVDPRLRNEVEGYLRTYKSSSDLNDDSAAKGLRYVSAATYWTYTEAEKQIREKRGTNAWARQGELDMLFARRMKADKVLLHLLGYCEYNDPRYYCAIVTRKLIALHTVQKTKQIIMKQQH